MLNYNWVILGDMFRPLNGHPQANLEYCCYLNNIVLSWPEDGRLTAETCRRPSGVPTRTLYEFPHVSVSHSPPITSSLI